MPRPTLLAFALLLTVSPSVVSAEDATGCRDLPFYSAQTDDGRIAELYLTKEQFLQTKPWTPEAGEPPLSVGKAMSLAAKWVRANWSQFGTFQVLSVDLTSVGCNSANRRWVYVVNFHQPTLDPRASVHQTFVGVMLDGTVLVPRTSGGDV